MTRINSRVPYSKETSAKNRGDLMRLIALPGAIALAAFQASVPASALDRHDIQGIWRQPDNGSLIQVYSCDGGICAKVVSTPDPELKDVKNPDPSLRGRPVAGLVLWKHPKESGDLQWIGSSYNTADGGTYYGTMHLTGPATLAVSVCNLSLMTCADQTWTKAAPQTATANIPAISKSKPVPEAPALAAPVPTAAAPAASARAAPPPAAPVPTVAAPVASARAAPPPVAPVPTVAAPVASARAAPPPAAPVQTAAMPAASARAVPKPKQAPVKVVEKPKTPPLVAEEKPKEVPERPRDPNGYEELPHIHVR